MNAVSLSQPDRAAQTDERQDQPVYLLFKDAKLAEELAVDLRQHGLRARTFVNLEVLRNAARTAPPRALLVELESMAPGGSGIPDELKAGIPLLFVAADDGFDSRLRAVQAGGVAFFSCPVNRPALLHRLHQLPAGRTQERIRVLILDDAQGGLTGAASVLDAAEMEVERVDDPAAVLERLAGSRFDLLVVSGALSGMAPTDLIQVVRQTETHYPLPTVILTPEDKRMLDEGATTAGVDAIVGLPIEPDDLVAIMRARSLRASGLRAAYSYLAKRDPATGLFNVGYFSESLRHALTAPGAGPAGALLYVQVESTPASARSVLVTVAEELRRRLPPLAVAAQVDSDGIAVLLPGTDAESLERLSQILGERLREPQRAGGTEFRCRVGITLLSAQQKSAADALARARQAAALQDPNASAPAPAQAEVAYDLWAQQVQEALKKNRFRLVYQPIASLSGQPTSFYEVFLRMLDEAGGDILPQEFLPSAERAGLACALDQWVVSRAIHVLEEQKSLTDQPVLFVKLFADTVADPRFASWLRDQLGKTRLDGARLVFQITHRTAALRLTEVDQFGQALAQLGCGLAIEHFGEGGTELLKSVKPQFVKLAAPITHDIGTNMEHQKLVQDITGQCRAVGARTVASLVQDALNLSVLWRCGVEYIQGYFMQEPADVFSPDETLGD